MKTKVYLLCIISIGVLVSCNNDDTSSDSESILGTWNFVNVRGGLNPINVDYNLGDVIWTFEQNGDLSVENNIMSTGPEQIYSQFETGVYSYVTEINSGTQYLYVENSQEEKWLRNALAKVDPFNISWINEQELQLELAK